MIEYYSECLSEDHKESGWDGPGWYFWDETQTQCYGPYESKEEAARQMEAYAASL